MSKGLCFQFTSVEVSGTITDVTSHSYSNGNAGHSVLVSYSHDCRQFENMRPGFHSSGKSNNRIKKESSDRRRLFF